jgi:hypothetical protein
MTEHNDRLRAWGQRMRDLDVPRHNAPIMPPAEHGHLGHNGTDIIAANTVYSPVSTWSAVQVILDAARHQHVGSDNGKKRAVELLDRAKAIGCGIKPRPTTTPGQLHFRGPGGGVITYDPDRVPPAEDIQRLGLRRISQEEAYGA